MTHDELLATIDEVGYCLENGHTLLRTEITDLIKALRAVIELHKPIMDIWFNTDGMICEECSREEYIRTYPCRTIQVIIKEWE